MPQPQQPSAQDSLLPNQSLQVNDVIVSSDGNFELVMQGDCNLVEYDRSGRALWASNTVRDASLQCYAIMQSDGNLVIYDQYNRPQWTSNTSGHPGAYVTLQDDANLVVYLGRFPLWASQR